MPTDIIPNIQKPQLEGKTLKTIKESFGLETSVSV